MQAQHLSNDTHCWRLGRPCVDHLPVPTWGFGFSPFQVKTGYRAWNSNTYVADSVTRSSADCVTEYGSSSTSTT